MGTRSTAKLEVLSSYSIAKVVLTENVGVLNNLTSVPGKKKLNRLRVELFVYNSCKTLVLSVDAS